MVEILEHKKVDEYLDDASACMGRDHIRLLSIARKALDLLGDFPDRQREGLAYLKLGLGYFYDGQLYESLSAYERALWLQKETGDVAGEALTNVNIGLVFSLVGEYNVALDYIERARILAHQERNEEAEAMASGRTGEIFCKLERFEDAEEFYRRALYLNEKHQNETGICLTCINLADVLRKQEQYKDADEFYHRALECVEANNLEVYKAYALLDQAEHLVSSRQLGKAEKILAAVFPLLEKGGRLYMAKAKRMLAQVYFGMKKFEKAKEACESALQASEEGQQREESVAIMRLMSDLIHEVGDETEYKRAYLYIRKASLMQQQLYNEKHNLKLSVIRAHYDLEISRLKTNELEVLNRELNLANAQKEKFFSIIAHDLMNPLSGIEGLSRQLVDHMHEMRGEDIQEIIRQLLKTSMRTSDLLKHLLDWARSRSSDLNLYPGRVPLQALLDDALSVFDDVVHKKELTVVVQVPENLEAYADRNTLYSVLVNLISNAAKFSHQKGRIVVSAEAAGKEVLISVADNGIGITAERKKQLFSASPVDSQEGTDGEKGHGLGLLICRDFVEKNQGTLGVMDNDGGGTIFEIRLPAVVS